MNIKKLILAWSAAFAVTIGMYYLFHNVIMMDFYEDHLIKGGNIAHPKFIILGYGLLVFLMAYVYPLHYRGGTPAMEGLKFGIFMGLLWRGISLLMEYGNGVIDSDLVIVDGAWHIWEQAITGIIIALIFGRDESLLKGAG